jgi:hypothetical protein
MLAIYAFQESFEQPDERFCTFIPNKSARKYSRLQVVIHSNKDTKRHMMYVSLVCGVECHTVTEIFIQPLHLALAQKIFFIQSSESTWKSKKNSLLHAFISPKKDNIFCTSLRSLLCGLLIRGHAYLSTVRLLLIHIGWTLLYDVVHFETAETSHTPARKDQMFCMNVEIQAC